MLTYQAFWKHSPIRIKSLKWAGYARITATSMTFVGYFNKCSAVAEMGDRLAK